MYDIFNKQNVLWIFGITLQFFIKLETFLYILSKDPTLSVLV